MTEPNLMNNKKMLFKYLSRWIELSTIFKLKELDLEINPKTIWKNEL
jgi:hypothetical protein